MLNSGLLFNHRLAISAVAELLFPPVTFELDLHCMLTQHFKYLGQSHFVVRIATHTHTGPIDLAGPLNWSVIDVMQMLLDVVRNSTTVKCIFHKA